MVCSVGVLEVRMCVSLLGLLLLVGVVVMLLCVYFLSRLMVGFMRVVGVMCVIWLV